MHDVIVFRQLAEIDLRAARLLARPPQREAARAVISIVAEGLGGAEEGRLRGGESEAANERADDELQRVGLDRREQIAQPLDLAFIVAKDVDAPALRAPFAELGEKALALDFIDHKVARFEIAETVIVKRRREIFRRE